MKHETFSRRNFFTILGGWSAILAARQFNVLSSPVGQDGQKPSTNIKDSFKVARNSNSMPGKYPSKVVLIKNERSVMNGEPVEETAYEMLSKAMIDLTGYQSLSEAWRTFVNPGEKIGLKVNPIAGKLLSTSHAVVKSVVNQLTECGIDKKDIIIWDRREMELKDAGFTNDNYPGITIKGTECQDKNGSFYDAAGRLYGENNIDTKWFYWADVDGQYDSETMPYMINGGRYSYFSKIVTREVDKIINIPILKNAGSSITNAIKNLAYGSISNTGRLHEKLWNETCAEVCAFAPLRDKVVLNICDALRGCFNGGPGANPQFICNFNSLLVSTDPVAMDRIAYDIIAVKRIEKGLLKSPAPESLTFLKMSESLGLGISDKSKIELKVHEII